VVGTEPYARGSLGGQLGGTGVLCGNQHDLAHYMPVLAYLFKQTLKP
jgi:hypothetical protein